MVPATPAVEGLNTTAAVPEVPVNPAVESLPTTPAAVPVTPEVPQGLTTTPAAVPEDPVTPAVEGLTPAPPRPTDEPLLSGVGTSESKTTFVVNQPEGTLPKTIRYSFDMSIIVLLFDKIFTSIVHSMFSGVLRCYCA